MVDNSARQDEACLVRDLVHVANSNRLPVTLDLEQSTSDHIRVQWQTNEVLPLQVLKRQPKGYAGMGLYDGVPVTLGLQVPTSLKPTLEVTTVTEDPYAPGQPFPGGAAIDELRIEPDASKHDWVWLETRPSLRQGQEAETCRTITLDRKAAAAYR